MNYGILGSPWASFWKAVAAIAIGVWLAFPVCSPVFAADGAQAASGAKEAAGRLKAYLDDLEKSKGKPDYAKPPASAYLGRIFDTGALAALPAPKADDFGWLLEWVASVDQTYIAMVMFGAKDSGNQVAGRNLVDYQDSTLPAAAFKLRLNAYAVSAMPAYLNSLPPGERTQARGEIEQSNRGLVQMATGMAGFIGIRLKLENVRLTAKALRDTVSIWAPLTTEKERTELLARLDKARTTNKDAGIDDAITAISTVIKNVKN